MLLDITPQLSSFFLRSCYGGIMKSINVKNYKEGLVTAFRSHSATSPLPSPLALPPGILAFMRFRLQS